MNQPSKWDLLNKQVGISHHNGDLPKTKCGFFLTTAVRIQPVISVAFLMMIASMKHGLSSC
jgi:hypothetical protein